MSSVPHSFNDPRLLELALTHASTGASQDNERLEFLGDAVLDVIVAEELFHLEPAMNEGDMTELKAWVVSRKVLAAAARSLRLDGIARVGAGMRDRALTVSMLANLYEAVLGAVYLDAGFEAARAFTRTTLAEQLAHARGRGSTPNEKQTLQRHCQVNSGAPPEYVVLQERGHAHARAFLISAEFGGRRFPGAWGRTRKEAERWAAHEALGILEDERGQRR